jgi:hypothetical protein
MKRRQTPQIKSIRRFLSRNIACLIGPQLEQKLETVSSLQKAKVESEDRTLRLRANWMRSYHKRLRWIKNSGMTRGPLCGQKPISVIKKSFIGDGIQVKRHDLSTVSCKLDFCSSGSAQSFCISMNFLSDGPSIADFHGTSEKYFRAI